MLPNKITNHHSILLWRRKVEENLGIFEHDDHGPTLKIASEPPFDQRSAYCNYGISVTLNKGQIMTLILIV